MPNFLLLLLNKVIHESSHRLLFCEIPVFHFLVKKLEEYVCVCVCVGGVVLLNLPAVESIVI